jgi:hypothetical protein
MKFRETNNSDEGKIYLYFKDYPDAITYFPDNKSMGRNYYSDGYIGGYFMSFEYIANNKDVCRKVSKRQAQRILGNNVILP